MIQHIAGIIILLSGCSLFVLVVLGLERFFTLTDKENMDEIYTEADLISFGNYLLSEERNKKIENDELREVVGDWDIANWNDSK